jgi:excisionase family DNA binding protein
MNAKRNQKIVTLTPREPVQPQPERLAFGVDETATILGLSKITVYRLIARGALRSSGPLRTKIISRNEIERFLTTEAA